MRAICTAGYLASGVALDLLDEQQHDEQPDEQPDKQPGPRFVRASDAVPTFREMAANPNLAATITEAVDLLVHDDMLFQALALVYCEATLLSPDPDALQVALRVQQLMIPNAVRAFAEGLHAALEARDANLLASKMRDMTRPRGPRP